MNKYSLLLLSAVLYLSSCSTDFSTVAPYKEVMVVYGLLNPNENIQYIRINKAYLGEGNALIMAQQPDSITYGDILDVSLERSVNGSVVESHSLIRVDTVPKNQGIFASSSQVIYVDTNLVDINASYKLTVHNRVSGLTATATTSVISDVSNLYPYTTVNFASSGNLLVSFNPGTNSKDYNVNLRFYYTEKDMPSGDTVGKSFDWNLGNELAENSTATMTYVVAKKDFFSTVAQYVLVDPNKRRRFDSLQIITTAVTEDVYTYISVTNPSTGIVQDRPLYTNVQNGIGIFSSRNIKPYHFTLAEPNTISALDTNSYTRDLGFVLNF